MGNPTKAAGLERKRQAKHDREAIEKLAPVVHQEPEAPAREPPLAGPEEEF